MGISPRAIEIRIDELVLHGIAAADRLRIGAALEKELARLLVERGAPAWFAGGGGTSTRRARAKASASSCASAELFRRSKPIEEKGFPESARPQTEPP